MAVAGAGAAGAAISRSCMESQCGKINFVGSERRGLPAPAFRLIVHADWCIRVNRDENLRFPCEERQRGLRG
jgi:malic enzyme